MYIQVTIDLKNYNQGTLDLRLSNHSSLHTLIDLAWQVASVELPPPDGSWVRILNKHKVCTGSSTMEEHGITSGDRIEIL
ncbi:EsaB/YukD family protein [Halobacillus faecis]